MPPRKPNTTRSKGSARQVLAKELARLREVSGKSLSDLAGETTYDRTYLHKLETGAKLGSPEVMAALDKTYGTQEHLSELWELARDDVFWDKSKRFMELERRATVWQQYATGAIPGLLQTKEYAREMLSLVYAEDEDVLTAQLTARMARQNRLYGEGRLTVRAILDEAVLRRPLRDAAAWQQQLLHLLEMAELRNVTVQVLPYHVGLHHLLGTSLTVLWLPDGTSVAYSETNVSAELFEEPHGVEQLKLSYDLLRDSALSPPESKTFIRNLMEASTPCASPDLT
ncbi:helix-turn-helix domain-containing protein [Streptomyces sp. YIM S03343]